MPDSIINSYWCRTSRAVDWRLWMLAIVNLLIAGAIGLICQRMSISMRISGVTYFALIQAQGVLLAMAAALLVRRPILGVLATLLLTSLLNLCANRYFVFIQTALWPLFTLAVLHGLRLWFRWRITREPVSEAKSGQFSTFDLLEWMCTVAAACGCMSLYFTQLGARGVRPDFVPLLQAWVSVAVFALLGLLLARVILGERLRLAGFVGVALLWIVIEATWLSFSSWWQTSFVWPSPAILRSWWELSPLSHLTFALTTAVNALVLRFFGYRWRSPVRQSVGS